MRQIQSKKRFNILFQVFFYLLFNNTSSAQPYLDIVYLKYTSSPDVAVFNNNKNDVTIRYFNVGTNLPIQFNNKKDALIFSPYYENWTSQINYHPKQNYNGIGLPVTLSKSISHSKWNILVTAIIRMNDSSIYKKAGMQVGGAFIAVYKKSEKLSWKLGVYVNNEFFGLFVMPLAGIDWNINSRNNLFGILPGSLTYEHRVNRYFYYGANFRAFTNSYAKKSGYWRIDENQLGIYLDTYFNKNIVLNMEGGHSLFRKIRTGIKDISKYDSKVNDNFYGKISLAYRVRFKK